MAKRITTFLMLICAFGSSAQTIFNITYERPGYEYISGLVQDVNDDFIISGTSGSYPDHVNSQALLIRTDSNGVVLWRKYYGTPEMDNGKNVVLMSNGDLVICGFSDGNVPNDYDMFITRTDNSGEELWTKYYGGSSWYFANYDDETLDGGMILVGETYSFGEGQKDAYILRLDANGDTLWTRTIGDSMDDSFNCVKSTSDGGFVSIGYKHDVISDQKDVFLVKWNDLGDTLWTKAFGGDEDDIGNFVDETSVGDLIFAADYRSEPTSEVTVDMMNYRLDSDGNVLFFHLNPGFGTATSNETSEIIRETADNGYANFGTVDSFQDLHQIMLRRMNDECNGSYNRLFGTQQFFVEEVGGAIVTNDGGYAMAGHTNFGDGPSNAFLIRTTINPEHSANGIIGIHDSQLATDLSVYPTPTSDAINVRLPSNVASQNAAYSVINSLGKVCQTGVLEHTLNSNINLENLEAGSYFLIIDLEEGRALKRIMKY